MISFKCLLFLFLCLTFVMAQTINGTSTNSTTNSTQSNVTLNAPSWLNSSFTELDRYMSDRYNYYVTPKGNRVWSCAMDLAWNEMKRSFLFDNNATFINATDLQQKVVNNYNYGHFTRDQLSDNSYYVGSGYG